MARRAIAAGDEVTYDVATSEIALELEMPCACGVACCRGVIRDSERRARKHVIPKRTREGS